MSSAALPPRGALFGVATFRGGAWAVGQAGVLVHGGVPRHLLVRVAGARVRRVRVPGPADGTLWGVAATSAASAWAVGFSFGSGSGGREEPLIVRWNGTAWQRSPLPSAVGHGEFRSVAATSETNAWAVMNPWEQPGRARIVHWNGRRWGDVVSPAIGVSYQLKGVAATSAKNAWAVGSTGSGRTVILHWNGRRWQRVPSPNPGNSRLRADYLAAVSASSAGNAWAVGLTASGPLTLHWNGHSWIHVGTPPSAPLATLGGVCFIPPTRNAWAVGSTAAGTSYNAPLILRSSGTTWR